MKDSRQTNSPLYQIVFGAAIAGIYIVLTMLFLPISFGPIQFRISVHDFSYLWSTLVI